jgi:hypothetical protein
VFSTKNNAITLLWTGTGGIGGGGITEALSTLANLNPAAGTNLYLVSGNTAYDATGKIYWQRTDLPDGFPAVADLDGDGLPEVVLVGPLNGQANAWILNGQNGTTKLGPVQMTTPGGANGGAPTIANFDGMGHPEIGVATTYDYFMLKPDFAAKTLSIAWQTPTHDYSSSVTGSTVFDFEGAGHPSVIYADECYLWVFDGATGKVRFATSHSSFTGTEASLVADVDGDGHAEILMVSNSASPKQWGCLDANNQPVTVNGVTWAPGPEVGMSYRGLVAFGDSANAWVGTRTLWSEHTYHVSNICDDRDTACPAPNLYGTIPKVETMNWTLPWLNNFRQNVQDKGIFDAPDAVVSLSVVCSAPALLTVSVRNIGLASLPAGVQVNLYKGTTPSGNPIGTVTTTHALFPGQTEPLQFSVPAGVGTASDTYVAQIYNNPNMPLFHECNTMNDTSNPASGSCSQ